MVLHRIAVVSMFAVSATAVLAQTASPPQSREIPAYTLPVPEDISPQMRALVAAPPAPWDIHPKSIAEWKELVAKIAAPAKTLLPTMREKLGVKLEQERRQRLRPDPTDDRTREPKSRLHTLPWRRLCDQSWRGRYPRRHPDGRFRTRQGDLGGLSH